MKIKLTIEELLKKAIENGDWSIICSLYKSITGSKIEAPKKIKPKNEFVDDGKLVKRETQEDKKLYNPPNLENRRQPIRYIKVKCQCGREDELPDNIAGIYLGSRDEHSEYKCQRCISRNKNL